MKTEEWGEKKREEECIKESQEKERKCVYKIQRREAEGGTKIREVEKDLQ
jgi:hypothetical protein